MMLHYPFVRAYTWAQGMYGQVGQMLLLLLQELTLHHPNIVNAKKNTEILYSTPTFLSRATK